ARRDCASRRQRCRGWWRPYIRGQCRWPRTMRRWRSRTARHNKRGSYGRWRRSTPAVPRPRTGRTAPGWSSGGACRREDRHRVGVVDLVPVEPDRDTEPVIRSRGLEHLDDLEIVSRVRERPGEQARHVAAQLVEGRVRIGKAYPGEEALELGQAQGTGVRGVAQLFEEIGRRRLCWILGCIIVDDDDT